MKTATFYQDDLAALHDAHYSGYSEAAAQLLLQRLRHQNLLSGTAIDLGCGSGKLTKIMADAGYETIGIDYSDDLLAIAKTHSPKTSFVRASLWDYRLPEYIANYSDRRSHQLCFL